MSSVFLQYVIIYAGALGGELLREGVWAPASTPDTDIHSILCRFGKLAMLAPLVFNDLNVRKKHIYTVYIISVSYPSGIICAKKPSSSTCILPGVKIQNQKTQ